MSSFVWLSVFPSFDEPRSRSSNSPLEVVLAVVALRAGLDVLQDLIREEVHPLGQILVENEAQDVMSELICAHFPAQSIGDVPELGLAGLFGVVGHGTGMWVSKVDDECRCPHAISEQVDSKGFERGGARISGRNLCRLRFTAKRFQKLAGGERSATTGSLIELGSHPDKGARFVASGILSG